ncbi:IclR family transcriptional regulator [Cobetia marina]
MSCHLSVREGTDAIYLYRAFAAQRMSVNIPIGSRLPCHVSAMGRILLTVLGEDELQQLYRQIRLDDYPPPAPQNLPALKDAIEEARRQGWVESRSDYATAIATGLYDHTGHLVGAINILGPDAMMADERRRLLLRGALMDCARHINHELGTAPPLTGSFRLVAACSSRDVHHPACFPLLSLSLAHPFPLRSPWNTRRPANWRAFSYHTLTGLTSLGESSTWGAD